MALLDLLEKAAGSGLLALLLSLWALGYQTREAERIRRERREDGKDCQKRVERLQKAIIELHLWAVSRGGRRRQPPPDISGVIGPLDDDDDKADAPPTQH